MVYLPGQVNWPTVVLSSLTLPANIHISEEFNLVRIIPVRSFARLGNLLCARPADICHNHHACCAGSSQGSCASVVSRLRGRGSGRRPEGRAVWRLGLARLLFPVAVGRCGSNAAVGNRRASRWQNIVPVRIYGAVPEDTWWLRISQLNLIVPDTGGSMSWTR